MPTKNATLLKRVWLQGTNDYQQRTPDPDQAGYSKAVKYIFAPNNNNIYNQFADNLVNVFGAQILHNKIWTSPLNEFSKSGIAYGSTIQEVAPKWIRAHSYQDDATDLLRMERPEFAVWYHSINREDKYPISFNRQELLQAALPENGDDYSLNRWLDMVMTIPQNSDNYDEAIAMINMIAEYEERWGFFKEHFNSAPSDEASAKGFLQKVKYYTNILPWPSVLYNASDLGVPVWAKPEELILFVDAETAATVDVMTLAELFHLDKAEVQFRQIVLPYFPVDGAFALLTTKDFFVNRNIVYDTTSFYDPNTLTNKYWLHHWQIIGVSPFVPAILFTTDTATSIPTVAQSTTGVTVRAADTTIAPGGKTQLTVSLTGTLNPSGEPFSVAPDAATYSIAATRVVGVVPNQETIAVPLNSRTRVDRDNVLHLQKTELREGDTVTVTATATYINPSGSTSTYTDDIDITVS